MRGTEGIHHEHIAKRRILARKCLVVLGLADIHAAIFQQHDGTWGDLDTVHPITNQRHIATEQLRQARGHRRQRIRFTPDAFFRSAQMRSDQYRGALVQGQAQGRQ